MIDKGYTKAAYQKMGKLMPAEFQIQDLGHGNSGMLRRGITYGIVMRVRNGWYKVAEGVKNPWKEYSAIATKIKQRGNPANPRGRKKKVLDAVNKTMPAPRVGPRVSVADYIGDQKLITIGKQLYLGIEVAVVPKGGK